MAAAMMSMSESIHASIILQKCLHPHQKDQLISTEQQNPKGIRFFVQVMLVSALFGIEMVIAFEQIYVILFHQFLGVPVSLLSINGIICGVVSMTLLPLLGYFSDRGTNPKRRKLFTLFVGMTTFLLGLLLLGIGGFIKLSSQAALTENRPGSNTSSPTTLSSTQISGLVNISLEVTTTPMASPSIISPQRNETELHGRESADSSNLPSTAILSIIGFSFIDIGFDMSASLTRAFILANVPTFQHTRLLVMATIVASMAGTTFSFIGCFDIPGALGPLFQVEGVAVTLIFFCAFLFLAIIIGYTVTIMAGYLINKNSCESGDSSCKSYKVTCVDNGVSAELRKRLKAEGYEKRDNSRSYAPDILHTEERDRSTRPLLLENSQRGNNYWALSISTSSIIHNSDLQAYGHPAMEFNTFDARENAVSDNAFHETENYDNHSEVLSKSETYNEFHNNCDQEFDERNTDNGESSFLAAIKESCSMSMSVCQPVPGEVSTTQLERNQNKKWEDSTKDDNKLRMNKRLTILCLSCFFTFGGMIAFIIYISNALTIGVIHGDPKSLPGTEAYELYQTGLRTAALGNLVLYVTYMVISVNNTRLLKLIGEKVQFVGCHLFMVVSLLALILTKRVEVYFLFMVSCGGLRTCVFTLPFVLANKFTQDENATGSKDSAKQSKNLGKVMSLIGFLIPAHYILESSFMGPLMDLTGSVWVPLIYSLCCCSMSVLIFSCLFFVKN